MAAPVIEAGDVTESENSSNDAAPAVAFPDYESGDLLISFIMVDGGAKTTVVPTTGPNGETRTIIGNGKFSGNGINTAAIWWVGTGTETSGNHAWSITPTGDTWCAFTIKVLAGEFYSANPVDSVSALAGHSSSGSDIETPAWSATAVNGTIVVGCGLDNQTFSAAAANWTSIADARPTGLGAAITVRDAATTAFESIPTVNHVAVAATNSVTTLGLVINEPVSDTTAPVLTLPTGITTGTTTGSGTVTTDEGNGTLYYLASENATETAATIAAASSQAVSGTGSQAVSFTGLTHNTLYYAHYVHDDAATNRSNVVSSSPGFTTNNISAAVAGTIQNNTLESDIVTGGRTIILTLTGDTFVTGTTSEDAIAGGSDSNKAGANKWDALIKVDLDNTDLVLSGGDTIATITLPAYATYDTDEQEAITWTIPAASLTASSLDIVGDSVFTISTVDDLEDTGMKRSPARSMIRDIVRNMPLTSSSPSSPPPPPPGPGSGEITETGGNARDGEITTLFATSGGLTGVTNVTINSINCTSEIVIDDYNMTLVSPTDDLMHNTSYTLAFTGGTAGNITAVFYLPPTNWDYVIYDGSAIPVGSILMYAYGQDDTSTAAAFLTDSTAAFPTDNSWDTGFIVRNTSDGSEGPITATTATTITATLAGGTNNNWNAGDYYEVVLDINADDQIVYETNTDNSGTVAMTVLGEPTITGPSGTHNFDVKYRDDTDSKVSATYTYTITV